jgi:hypothetical protein
MCLQSPFNDLFAHQVAFDGAKAVETSGRDCIGASRVFLLQLSDESGLMK